MSKLEAKNVMPLSFFLNEEARVADDAEMFLVNPRIAPKNDQSWIPDKDWIKVKWEIDDRKISYLLDAASRYMLLQVGGYPGVYDPVPFTFLAISESCKGRWKCGGSLCVNGSWQSGAKRGVNINFNIYGHGFIYGYEAKMIEPARSFRHVISYDDLSPNKFEALVFRYLEMSDEFDRPEWLQSTNAGDSGRDISAVERRTKNRVAVQAKHWLKSINQNEIHSCIPSLMTWNPPFDKLLFVASGTFTQNAIRYSENNNDINNSIEIELWSGEMFKARLANYPALLPHG